MNVDNFFYKVGQTLRGLTSVKSYMRTKKDRREYKGHASACIIIVEAVASQDLWIWHLFFGMAGSHNDINVLQDSLVFARLAEGNNLQSRWGIVRYIIRT